LKLEFDELGIGQKRIVEVGNLRSRIFSAVGEHGIGRSLPNPVPAVLNWSLRMAPYNLSVLGNQTMKAVFGKSNTI